MNELDLQRGPSLAERLKQTVSWANTLWTIVGWFGWKQLLLGSAIAVAGWVYGYVRDDPIVTLSMSAVYLFIGLAFVTKLPTMAELMSSKPTISVWRHVDTLALWHAACLFDEMSPPPGMGPWLPTPDADARDPHALAGIAPDLSPQDTPAQMRAARPGNPLPPGINIRDLMTHGRA